MHHHRLMVSWHTQPSSAKGSFPHVAFGWTALSAKPDTENKQQPQAALRKSCNTIAREEQGGKYAIGEWYGQPAG